MSETKKSHKHTKLNEAFATAICGNDILSSCLYVSGIAITFAGAFAPLVLLFVAGILYLYKFVYTEVVEALPVNGGAYNCLLNGTSKTVAAIAGVMTILSYVATAVISAKVGIEYINSTFEGHSISLSLPLLGHTEINLIIAETIALLLVFALLVINGLKDSAKVALGIFIFHIASLIVFAGASIMHVMQKGAPYLFENIAHTNILQVNSGSLLMMLYLAFSASLLGVSGFESSANFVEEQDKGVFRKTLRNMLIGVAVFNPIIALAVLASMPYDTIVAAKDFLLADAGLAIGGVLLQYLIVIDAFLVLSGAVLTSFVGISGLVSRMALDDCLPLFLSKTNKKGSFPRIIWAFFALCSSILLITQGNLLSLAGVYTIAFLSVMTMFAFGNLILKEARTELKRTFRAPRRIVIPAMIATLLGIVGNIHIDPANLEYFELYFIPALVLVLTIIYKDAAVRLLVRATRRWPNTQGYILKRFRAMAEGTFVVFLHNPAQFYHHLQYINKNETGKNIIVVHCDCHCEPVLMRTQEFLKLKESMPYLQTLGVFPHFNMTFDYVKKRFSPDIVDAISKKYKISKNRILIGSLHGHHPFNYEDFGGVRIIGG